MLTFQFHFRFHHPMQLPSFIIPQLSSLHCPHAWEQLSPCFLQLHLRLLQPVEQLQWIIFRSASGAGLLSNMTGIRLLSW